MKGAIPKKKFLSFQLVRKDTSPSNPLSSSATLIHPSLQTQVDNDCDDNNVDDNNDDDDNNNDDDDNNLAVPRLESIAIIQSDDEEETSLEVVSDGQTQLGKVGTNDEEIESPPAREHDGPTLHLQSKSVFLFRLAKPGLSKKRPW